MSETFPNQADVGAQWRVFVDGVAPLRRDLFRYCRGLTGNVWDGEDLAQDVLVKVFAALGKNWAPLENPRAYLIRAATRLWIDRMRRAALERAHAAPSDDVAPDDPSLTTSVREAASTLFQRLPPKERATVLLKDVLDFSLEETAQMLQSNTGAVKSALHRGRARLAAAQAEEPQRAGPPREIVERFVAALAAKEFDAIRDLCLADVSIDMVGGASAETFEKGRMVFEHAHFVLPEMGFGEAPRWEIASYEGEPIVLGFRTRDGREGLSEIWRFDAEEGRIVRARLYCFNPEILEAVAKDLGLPHLTRRHRSPPY
ncbi:MAG: sigma-70 family RNA polymerase sigma factor [Hyphomonadaceae bacterium]